MKATSFTNEIFVLGADHHTTLAVIRCLAHYGHKPTLLLHGVNSRNNSKLFFSRYAKEVVTFHEDEELILSWLQTINVPTKALLIPTSDFAALIVDKNSDTLSQFYFPGFLKRPGMVAKLMDKMEQKSFADTYGIPMAPSWVMHKNDIVPDDIIFPCIVKPLRSAYGSKSSIFVAQNKNELKEQLLTIKYPVLIQKFLIKKYETCAYGVMEDNEPRYRGGLIKKIHEANGSTVFAEVIENDELTKKICDLLWSLGYRGMYDFEMLVCEDNVYLNEINFRSSGNGYALEANGIPAPLIWCNSVLGINNSCYSTTMKPGFTHINDVLELVYSKRLGLGLLGAVRNIFVTKSRAVLDFHDFRCSWAFYLPLIQAKVGKAFSKITKKEAKCENGEQE